MRYWILKGTPDNDWRALLNTPGRVGTWHTYRPPIRLWNADDRLFCWESSPGRRLVGLASLASVDEGRDEDGRHLFGVRYLTPLLPSPIHLHDLRNAPIISTASFLRPGPAGTVQSLSTEHAEALFRLVVSRNPDVAVLWPDLNVAPFSCIVPDLEALFVTEGASRLVFHRARERSHEIVSLKKATVLGAVGNLACEACSFDFSTVYGPRGHGFCEVHHVIPLSDLDDARATRLEDLVVLCSNCHRMIHRTEPWLSVSALRALVHGAA